MQKCVCFFVMKSARVMKALYTFKGFHCFRTTYQSELLVTCKQKSLNLNLDRGCSGKSQLHVEMFLQCCSGEPSNKNKDDNNDNVDTASILFI